MALETLVGIEEIDGFKINRLLNDKSEKDNFYEDEAINCFGDDFIAIDHDNGFLGFLIQDGPVKEFGVNGCQIDTILKTCQIMLEKLNFRHPCQENESAIIHLERAIECLALRKKDREQRGVEGTDKP